MEAEDWREPPEIDERALHLAGLDDREINIMRRAFHPGNDTPDLPWSILFCDAIEKD